MRSLEPGAEQWLDVKEAAERLRTTPAALTQMRYRGHGPPFILLGRRVRYPASRLHENSGQSLSPPRVLLKKYGKQPYKSALDELLDEHVSDSEGPGSVK